MSTWRTRQRLRKLRNVALGVFVCALLAICAALMVERAMLERATASAFAEDSRGSLAGSAETEKTAEADLPRGSENEEGSAPAASELEASTASFPPVDWDHWLGINPDILGWVSIPGTSVSYPVVLPPALQPTFYLDHDVYGEFNRYGSIYLDDECREDGLFGGKNTVILGHHMSNGAMFAALANYVDEGYLEQHPVILLQTPHRKAALHVIAVDVIPGDEAVKRTTFVNDADFERWWKATVANTPAPPHVWTFCTCSYFFQDDERTLVYAVEKTAL